MARPATVVMMALLLGPPATVAAQTASAAAPIGAPTPATPVLPMPRASLPSPVPAAAATPAPPPAQSPGDPSNPANFTGNPHPDMLWYGVATPYGQFLRWVWVPPAFANVDGRIVERPGYWVAVTTAGYYVVDHWEVAQGPTGERVWRMVPSAFQPR